MANKHRWGLVRQLWISFPLQGKHAIFGGRLWRLFAPHSLTTRVYIPQRIAMKSAIHVQPNSLGMMSAQPMCSEVNNTVFARVQTLPRHVTMCSRATVGIPGDHCQLCIHNLIYVASSQQADTIIREHQTMKCLKACSQATHRGIHRPKQKEAA